MEFGISIYPEHSTLERDREYIETAARYGCRRIFTCLLSAKKDRDEIIRNYRDRIDIAHQYGMEVILDTAPAVFKALGITFQDLSFFKELHADGIRLDEAFDSLEESLMTYNPQNLKIEVNASFGNRYLDNVVSHHPKMENLISCFNFYPQRYTGISYGHFEKCCTDIRKLGIPISVFIGSQQPDTFGPWEVNDGMCTLEMHRDLPADVAARHLFATGLVDTVIFADCYASEEEMRKVTESDPSVLTFRIEEEIELTKTEQEILYRFPHFVRGDMSEYMARSTQPRVVFAEHSIAPRNTRDLKRGDVVILNDRYDRYKGELHVVLKDMPNDGRKNVAGHVPENEMILLDYICPWRRFGFIH
ncbi:MAG TPA: DUF871 family protein [Candidatus Mediterraneibacter norfolkensis]|nr:DUF871 family protein [Candidatus Mediterraneibacter norfolkensis]